MSENDRLAEIKARCEAATPGPWAVSEAYTLFGVEGDWLGDIVSTNEADVPFIRCCREDVPHLLTEVERLRAEVARLEAKSKALRAECSDLWEVIERAKDALRDYDGICLEGAQGAWEILQGALDEGPNNAS